MMNLDPSINVYGNPLRVCCQNPTTGYFRNGCCDTNSSDSGVHTVCVIMTDQFLTFSKAAGNDLSTPRPEFDFHGLKAGDKWCLCADRWQEAFEADCAPKVILESTHIRTLDHVRLIDLETHAINNIKI